MVCDACSLFKTGLEDFLVYLSLQRNLSTHSIRAYKNDLTTFIDWLEQQPGLSEEMSASESDGGLLDKAMSVSESDGGLSDDRLRALPYAYSQYLSAKTLARSSVARKLSALRTFFKYLLREQVFPLGSLSLQFQAPKAARHLPDFLTPEEVAQLEQTIRPPRRSLKQLSPIECRNLLIVSLLFTAGLRVSELTGLSLEDLQLADNSVKVLGKGRKERIAFYSAKTGELFDYYLAQVWPVLANAKPTVTQPVFLNYQGKRLSGRSVHRMLCELADNAKLGKTISPHTFRHSFATCLLNKGVELRIVQELLGHSSIRTTQIYTHLTTERLKAAYMKAHPLAQSL